MGSFQKLVVDVPVSKYNVLVVDDAPSILKMTTLLFKRKGHNVQTAENGAEALEILVKGYADCTDGSSPYDVVIMDLQMPVMDGIEAITRLRAAEAEYRSIDASSNVDASKHYHQLVIAASANSDAVTRQQALDAGADVFLGKPYTYADFLNAKQLNNIAFS